MDFRNKIQDRFTRGIADIRISRHPLRKDVIVVLNDADHNIYMDLESVTEVARLYKQAIVEKNPDMYYVQQQYEVFSEPDDIIPFVVNMTMSGLPRPLMLDDRILIEGTAYVVTKVKPINREIKSVLEVLVYPERDSRMINDPLCIYKIIFRRGLNEVDWTNAYGEPVVMEVLYGGCPRLMSFDGENWTKFYQKSRVILPDWATKLFIMDEGNYVSELQFGETYSVERSVNESDVIYR